MAGTTESLGARSGIWRRAGGALARRGTPGSVNRRILSALLTVAGLTAVVKVAGAGKEVLVANRFGTSGALDAYLAAFLVPSVVLTVVAAALQSAFVPVYVRVREREGAHASLRLLASYLAAAAALLALCTLLLAFLAGPAVSFVAPGFTAEQHRLATGLLRVLCPLVLFGGLFMAGAGVMQAGERFAAAALAPLATPVLLAAVLLLLPG
ncbi:MAG TPA: lipid II flippase MurJ, partial [Longimicrobium sp.]|uniref:lipid II flippase MurJ n=1 Tax=Longimicrobium sp. TaxID=2029185 RepID=UPI002ED7D300